MKNKRLTYGLFLLLISSKLVGQTDLQLNYKYSEDFKKPVFSVIKLHFPNGKIDKLYTDTLKTFDLFKPNYLKNSGSYSLYVFFAKNDLKTDSLSYNFKLDGKETDVKVDISFYIDRQRIRQGGKWIEKSKIPRGTIYVTKYYEAPKSVHVNIDSTELGDEYYKGPFFKITNNSRDTIYGEYLPGYFWGTLSIQRNDSTWSRNYTGNIDTEFVGKPPLSPDSSRIATVGSFGMFKKLFKTSYCYELLFTKNNKSRGASLYENHETFQWWTTTDEFYRLKYKFKID